MSLDSMTALRDRVEREFQKVNYDHAKFAALASAALSEAELAKSFRLDFDELTRWMLVPGHLPPANARRQFSDLPTVVASGNGFYVEILVWSTGTAAIHQHAFSGAFT